MLGVRVCDECNDFLTINSTTSTPGTPNSTPAPSPLKPTDDISSSTTSSGGLVTIISPLRRASILSFTGGRGTTTTTTSTTTTSCGGRGGNDVVDTTTNDDDDDDETTDAKGLEDVIRLHIRRQSLMANGKLTFFHYSPVS